jgi:hemerythrin-like domain-containing protein
VSTQQPIEVRDMAIVHRTFREAFSESASLVRAETHPSADRVAFLSDHIEMILSILHGHHASEDELLWPPLLARAPDEAATVQRVADQHQEVSGAIERVQQGVATWRQSAGHSGGEALADSLVNLNAVLQSHLNDEESLVVPLAATVLTQKEWNDMGEHSRQSIPKDKMFVAFGMLLEPLSDADRAYMLSEVPAPVKLLWKTLGQRSWRKYRSQLRGA